jgi:hypothetical protein
MRKFIYLLVLGLSISLFNSCLVDDETSIDANGDGPCLVTFELAKTTVTAVADGNEYEFTLKLKVVGPGIRDLNSDVVATIAANTDLSTAIAGTHFNIPVATVNLTSDNNYLGFFTFKMLTNGIYAPLDESPLLYLNVTSVTGDSKIENTGKPIEITLNYACFSNLEGDYSCHAVITRSISGAVTTYDWTEFITETGTGQYRTYIVTYDGYVNPYGAGQTPGYTFYDVCNVITVPEQNLIEYYSNIVVGTAAGWSDPITGKIHIEYSTSTTAAAGNRNGIYDYTKIP